MCREFKSPQSHFFLLLTVLSSAMTMLRSAVVVGIAAPVARVFRFCLDPRNTPKWIPSVLEERSSNAIVSIGTVFSQRVEDGNGESSNAVVVTGLVENERLDFHAVNSAYACYYRFEPVAGGTRLSYVEEAGLDEKLVPLPESCFRSLKELIEAGH